MSVVKVKGSKYFDFILCYVDILLQICLGSVQPRHKVDNWSRVCNKIY